MSGNKNSGRKPIGSRRMTDAERARKYRESHSTSRRRLTLADFGAAASAVEFLVQLYRDPDAPADLRLKAAIAAAPYQQPKYSTSAAEGKKEQARIAAQVPADGKWAFLDEPNVGVIKRSRK